MVYKPTQNAALHEECEKSLNEVNCICMGRSKTLARVVGPEDYYENMKPNMIIMKYEYVLGLRSSRHCEKEKEMKKKECNSSIFN